VPIGKRPALAVADAKRFDLPLDRRSPEGDPVAQIRDYVLLSRKPFGILTNGRLWRLYARESPLVERACHEVDLVELLEHGSPDDLRYFAAFFGAQAFRPGPDGRTFLERALDDSVLHAVDVSSRLEAAVFAAVPPIAEGLLGTDSRTREALDEAFASALIFLYRVLFALFAEARELLPLHNVDYRRYSVAEHRVELARLIDTGAHLSATHDGLFSDLRALFRTIDRGDPALGVPEYDGGLFDPEQHPWLEGRSVSDALLGPALDGIYRIDRAYVDYRDLSVRTLGTVYERLLAWELVDQGGSLVLEESPRRHELGSYFTPEPVVDAIVERTLDPIVTRRSREINERRLAGQDALDELLSIRVLDPAMGSAHFLVGAVEFLAQAIATDPSYDGQLSLPELRRLVAERCLYGVDLNPLAVELARLSIWLVTANETEPLTFLANLRCRRLAGGCRQRHASRLDDGTVGSPHRCGGRDSAPADGRAAETRHPHGGRRPREAASRCPRSPGGGRRGSGRRRPLEVFAEQAIERFRPPANRPRLHWPLEFPEVFVDERGEPREDAGFDAVIGNPPYIRVQEIGRDVADYCRTRFETPRGSFDAYLVFLERGLSLLAQNGRLGFIVPNKLFKLDFAQRMRALLSDGELVAEVLDFGASQVFAEVTNYTCILVLDRAGLSELSYRRIRGSRDEVLAELVAPESIRAQRFVTRTLGANPWVLVPPEEAAVIEVASTGSERLDAVTRQIFQGLITSADDVYVLEDRGERGGRRVVFSRASGSELELEPDLLHPLASGGDVDRYAFRSLSNLLLFPYARGGAGMRLLRLDELGRLARTFEYLAKHEARLRGRERGAMDHDGWYAFGRTQSLGNHHRHKLGVPRLCDRLRAAFDDEGSVYLDNVDVNGILLVDEGVSPWILLAALNSRLLDWIFRRGSVPFQNEFWSANKQFIRRLPIRIPPPQEARELETLGRQLHELARRISEERGGFLSWLASTVGASQAALRRRRELVAPEQSSADGVIRTLARLAPPVDPRERMSRELIEREHRETVNRLLPLVSEIEAAERQADDVVFELYGLPAAMRELVDSEYGD